MENKKYLAILFQIYYEFDAYRNDWPEFTQDKMGERR